MNLILTSTQTPNGKLLDDQHIYITVGPNCWGKGKTAAEAYKNARHNGPSNCRRVVFVTRVAFAEGLEVDPVDGSVWHAEKHDAKTCSFCTIGKGIRISTDKTHNEKI